MWNVLRHQIRTYVSTLKKNREKEKSKPSLHIRRTAAQVVASDALSSNVTIVQGRVILNDVGAKGLYLFTTAALGVGQKVSLTMEEPRRFYIKGKVLSCQTLILDRRIISEVSYPYRIGIEFIFDTEEERDAVKKYCDELRAEEYYQQAA